jgi:hypothetical protein
MKQTQQLWRTVFDGTDACVAPVLRLKGAEGPYKPLIALSESPCMDVAAHAEFPTLEPGEGCEEVLRDWVGGIVDIDVYLEPKMKVALVPANRTAKLYFTHISSAWKWFD